MWAADANRLLLERLAVQRGDMDSKSKHNEVSLSVWNEDEEERFTSYGLRNWGTPKYRREQNPMEYRSKVLIVESFNTSLILWEAVMSPVATLGARKNW